MVEFADSFLITEIPASLTADMDVLRPKVGHAVKVDREEQSFG